MFKKRFVGNVKNRKKTEDIKDGEDKEKQEEEEKKTNEENTKKENDNSNDSSLMDANDMFNKKKRVLEEDHEISDDDVVCKYFFKKKLKKMNEENSLLLRKKQNKLIHCKSEDITQSNTLTEDRIYKGDFSGSKNYGSYEIDQDIKNDHRSIMERNIKIGEEILKGNLKDNIYRGKDAHEKAIMIKKDSLAKNKYTGLYGPVRSSGSNVRVTLRIDYEPCICKDYKETGYCGFGDTCIYLHDRSDYKSGWKIEQEYEQKRKRDEALRKEKMEKWNEKMLKKLKEKEERLNNHHNNLNDNNINNDQYSDEHENNSNQSNLFSCSHNDNNSDTNSVDSDTSLPFACIKCKKKWKIEMNPSVTECMHYFCEKCFIDMFQKNKKCFKCGLQLNGIMNTAQNIIDILNKRKTVK